MANKITNRFYIRIVPFNIKITVQAVLLITSCFSLKAQGNEELRVLKTYSEYIQTVKKDSAKKMVSVISMIPDVMTDIRYATKNNFTHHQLYKKRTKPYLRLPVAQALWQVQTELSEKNLSLKIWDAYRPYSATVKMWDLVKDERFVADPKKGSGHNRGIAIDLTIVNKTTGQELDMGTGFDSFSDSAHRDFKNLSSDILQNRLLLKTLMSKYGFIQLETEWWHFYWNKPDFELLDIDPAEFKKN